MAEDRDNFQSRFSLQIERARHLPPTEGVVLFVRTKMEQFERGEVWFTDTVSGLCTPQFVRQPKGPAKLHCPL